MSGFEKDILGAPRFGVTGRSTSPNCRAKGVLCGNLSMWLIIQVLEDLQVKFRDHCFDSLPLGTVFVLALSSPSFRSWTALNS